MNPDLQGLIDSANRLCDNLGKAAQNEKAFCYNICHQLEMYSLEMYKISRDLKTIKEHTGV